ncbi:MAG: hypothetical protein WBA45_09055 [Microthrixaceae bacterium]
MKADEQKNDDDSTRSSLKALGDELEQAISHQLVGTARNLTGGVSDPHRQGRRRGTLALATLGLVVVAAAAVVFTTTAGSGEQAVLSASPQNARTEARSTADESSGDPSVPPASMSGEEFKSTIFLKATPFVGTNPVCEPSGPTATRSSDGSTIGAFTCTLVRAPTGMSTAADGGLPSTQMYISYHPDRTSIIETRCDSDATRLVWNCSSESNKGEWLAHDRVEGFTWTSDPGD